MLPTAHRIRLIRFGVRNGFRTEESQSESRPDLTRPDLIQTLLWLTFSASSLVSLPQLQTAREELAK